MFVTRSGESTANPSVRVIWAPTNSGVCVGTTLDFFELIKKSRVPHPTDYQPHETRSLQWSASVYEPNVQVATDVDTPVLQVRCHRSDQEC